MSLFKRVHVVTVPPEFLDVDDPKTQLRFSQLNAKKMAKADLNEIMEALSDEQRQASLDRQRTTDAESTKRAQKRAEEPSSPSRMWNTSRALARRGPNSQVTRSTTCCVSNGLLVKSTTSASQSLPRRGEKLVALASHLSHGPRRTPDTARDIRDRRAASPAAPVTPLPRRARRSRLTRAGRVPVALPLFPPGVFYQRQPARNCFE